MPLYWDNVTGERVLVDDFDAIRRMLNGGEDISEELPPMTHDPFCPQAQMYQDDAVTWWANECQEDFDCRCELIAKVRENERKLNAPPDPVLAEALDKLCGG